jgi:two-component system OmpR family response regulator
MRVLLVEDETLLADSVAQALRREGYAVDLAGNGIDGLHQAREVDYDAVVLDVMLPGISGLEVLRQLRADEVWMPVLMLTARDSDRDVATALDLGADDYLPKPFSLVVLVARLRALLRRGAPQRPAVLTAGDLVLDPATHRCQRAGTTVALTTREFALLEFLLRRAGEVVPKHEVLEHVWDEHYDGDMNVLEVYVGYLRKKIDRPFERNAIETVRGVGYRLRADGG